MVCGIYSILNKVNGKIYVGQSVNLHRRWIQHKHKLRDNSHPNDHLQKAWNKYGEDSFEYNPLEHCDDTKLNENEIWWIKYFDSTNREKGYNLMSGGNVDFKVSDETREKLRIANLGKTHSEETKQKLRKANLGKKLLDETKKKVSESLTGTDRQYNARHSISKSQNTTGYFRVCKISTKQNEQGFMYRYCYYVDRKRKSISSISIDILKRKVLERGLEWIEY